MLKDSALIAMLVAVLFSFSAHAEYAADPLEKDSFSFREPSVNDLSTQLNLWATYYYLPQLKDGSGDIALRDMKNQPLGPSLSIKDWCESALEGSVRILGVDGIAKTYNFAGSTMGYPVDCSAIFRFDLSKSKFREANGPYGDGIDQYILAPYRTIATDKSVIAPGTVIYVPQARGAKIVLDSGRVLIHDGYFFAADRGGAIKGDHIDVFIGTHTDAPFFPWIKSKKNELFVAYIITDKAIISELTQLHIGR